MSRNAEFTQPETVRARTASIGSALSWVSIPGKAEGATCLEMSRKRGVQAARLPLEPGGTGSKLSYRSHRAQRSGERDRAGSSHTCLRLIAAGRKLGLFCLPDSAWVCPKLRSAND